MKKKLPLDVIKGFTPKFGETIEFEKTLSTDRICIFKDKDIDSDFYFEIKQLNEQNNKFLVEFKPAHKGTISPTSNWFSIQDLNSHFNFWVNLIEEYNSVETIFDDPFIESYQKEFIKDAELIDDDADIKPFSIDIILRIDKHLEHIENNIHQFENDDNIEDLKEIKLLAQHLRRDITKKTKNQVLNKLVGIWAKLSKQGPKLIREFLTEGGKMIVKESIKYLIGKGVELIN